MTTEKSPPASYYEPPAGAPDQPDLPTRCSSCHAFLKRTWEYEDEEIEDERRRMTVLVFFTTCKACGDMHRVYA